MNEIMNHGYVAPPRARAATVADLPRESEERPYIVGELTGEFDPFNDFPAPSPHGLRQPPREAQRARPRPRASLEDVGGHEMSATTSRASATTNPPPLASQLPAPDRHRPGRLATRPSQGPEHPPDHHHLGQWQTTAQAQMSQAAAPRRRSGKRMVPPQGAPTGSLMARGADGSFGASEHAYGRVGFGPKPAPLAPRADVLHRNVDPRGGCGTETLPFVPGYGGHVPETRVNFGEAARRGLAQRAPKDLLVENFNPRMPGCTKGRVPGGSEF